MTVSLALSGVPVQPGRIPYVKDSDMGGLFASYAQIRALGWEWICEQAGSRRLGRGLITAKPQPDAGELDHGGERAGA
jgi:hypothetical protein